MEQDQILIRVKVIKNIEDAGFQEDEIVYMTKKEVNYYQDYVEELNDDPIKRFATQFKKFEKINWETMTNRSKDDE